jgi:hypothetical protein
LTRRLLAAIALVLVPLAEARSQDEELDRSDEIRLARSAAGFASVFGITGMREMIEARVPERPIVRGMLQAAIDHQQLSFGEGSVTQTTDSVGLQLTLGGSFARIFDFGMRWIPIEQVRTQRTGAPTQVEDKSGGLDLAAKISLPLGSAAAIAPYAIFHFELGGHDLYGSRGVEAGSAFVFAFARDQVALHATLAYADRSGQASAFRFRVGASWVAVAEDSVLVHPFVYLDGVEPTDAGLGLRIDFGVQVRLFDSLVVSAAVYYYLVDDSSPPGTKDEGSWGVRFGLGLKFLF